MFKNLLVKQIINDDQIKGMLTTYNGEAAFFDLKSPRDSDDGWTKPCYPRADYTVDMQYDPERKTSGVMSINIWCTNRCPIFSGKGADKAIEERLIELIDGTFYTGDDDNTTICAVWNRSETFEFDRGVSQQDDLTIEIFGITALFDLTEFPEQITTAPDPVLGINSWTKGLFPQMTVIAHDKMPPVWKPTDEKPAIYWRFIGVDSDARQSYSVTWYTGLFAAHVIAKSITERNRWTKAIIERIQLDGEIVLEDTSPMFINQISVRHGADSLREGQIEIKGRYGVLEQHRKEEAEIRLLKPHFDS